jgi:hypothetical protein
MLLSNLDQFPFSGNPPILLFSAGKCEFLLDFALKFRENLVQNQTFFDGWQAVIWFCISMLPLTILAVKTTLTEY